MSCRQCPGNRCAMCANPSRMSGAKNFMAASIGLSIAALVILLWMVT